jgi:hypothetical protein
MKKIYINTSALSSKKPHKTEVVAFLSSKIDYDNLLHNHNNTSFIPDKDIFTHIVLEPIRKLID